MKNIWKRLFFVLLACLILGTSVLAICVSNFMNKGGVTFLGPVAHLAVNRKCYFLEGSEVLAESNFLARGFAFGDDFYGVLDVEGYPLSTREQLETGKATGDCKHLALTANGIGLTTDSWNRYYDVYIPRSNPDVILIRIHHHDGSFLTAICANSEEEALENYQLYRESMKVG